MTARSVGLLLGAMALWSGCASDVGTLADLYRWRDHEGRRMFLAYYPELSPERRREILASDAPPRDLIEAWKVEARYFGPKSYQIERVDIEWDGEPIRPRAILRYADGRTADASADVQWTVSPPSARLEEGEIRVGCMSSDVEITADFLAIKSGRRTLSARKPLRSLEIAISEETLVVDNHGLLRLKAKVTCEDGTSEDVTCQADWKSRNAIPVGRCGTVEAGAVSRGKNDTAWVRVSYGHLSTDFLKPIPRRDITR